MQQHIAYTKPAGKFRPNWTARLGDVEAFGRTKEEAQDRLFAQLKAACTGSFTPVMICHKGYVALLWRDGAQWCYTIRAQDVSGAVTCNIHMIGADRAIAERKARRHLADYALETCYHPEEAAECIENEQDRREFLATCYRSCEVKRIMDEHGLDWQAANMRYDGLDVGGAK